MVKYITLLRGINVSGGTKSRCVRAAFEKEDSLRLQRISIAAMFFSSDIQERKKLIDSCRGEALILEHFDLNISVAIVAVELAEAITRT